MKDATFGVIDQACQACTEGKSIQIRGGRDAEKRFFVWQLLTKLKTKERQAGVFVVVKHSKELAAWRQFFEHSLTPQDIPHGELSHFGFWGSDRHVNHHQLIQNKLAALHRVAFAPQSCTVTTLAALRQRGLGLEAYRSHCQTISVGQELDPDELVDRLHILGYHRMHQVEESGSYCLRGGVLDIFPPHLRHPVRMSWFGDELRSIRSFSAHSQHSLDKLDQLVIGPANQLILSNGERQSAAQRLHETLLEQQVKESQRAGMVAAVMDHTSFPALDMFTPYFLSASQTLTAGSTKPLIYLFPSSGQEATLAYQDFYQDAEKAQSLDLEHALPVLSVSEHFELVSRFDEDWGPHESFVEWNSPLARTDCSVYTLGSEKLTALAEHQSRYDAWLTTISQALDQNAQVHILVNSREEFERLAPLFAHRDHTLNFEKPDTRFSALICGHLGGYIWDSVSERLVVSAEQILPRSTSQQSNSAKLKKHLSSFRDLAIGDLVVHKQHGIGRYTGLRRVEAGGQENEFLSLSYRGGDKIYLAVDRLGQISKYRSSEVDSGEAQLDRLGQNSWERKKNRTRQAAQDIADSLLRMEADRKLSRAPQVSPPDEMYRKFEADFPYTETDDQLRAISEVEADLAKTKPMDRLVIGDVGFGKTEVALRAAMRMVLEGQQVLVLVPTTVLCYQQYQVFFERLDKYGIRVDFLNRFKSSKDQKTAVLAFNSGKIDVLVGTHRLLSKDLKPQKLGLLVIDEEQKFGVTHKARLRELRTGSHVLTLSATPIPRTLHMSMLGLRDLSLIVTPPTDRQSIKTIVTTTSETVISQAIRQELERGGQVFFVHNRVSDIEEIANVIRRLLPHAAVAVAHGQMRERALEDIIISFIEQRFQILVCTTIIESGVDMPNVNTLIVNDADHFGLSQLYQLRGRVGRSDIQAHAYFLVKNEESILPDARRRLDALVTFQDLGSGFRIAQHDMEIRGVGNLLGAEQSGHISSVGLDLFVEMLDEAISQRRVGQETRKPVDPEIKIKIAAHIAASYIAADHERLELYRRIFAATDDHELFEIATQTADRFGPAPTSFERLLQVARIKLKLKEIGATALTPLGGGLGYEVKVTPPGTNLKEAWRQFASREKSWAIFRQPDRWLLRDNHSSADQAESILELLEPLSLCSRQSKETP